VLRALLDALDADMALAELIGDRLAADDGSLTITSNAVTQNAVNTVTAGR